MCDTETLFSSLLIKKYTGIIVYYTIVLVFIVDFN